MAEVAQTTSLPPRAHRKSSRRSAGASSQAAGSALSFSRPSVHQSSSPEVISSLINSLSAISTDAEHHFDQLPRLGSQRNSFASLRAAFQTSAVSKSQHQPSNVGDLSPAAPVQKSFGVDYGAYKSPPFGPDQSSYLLEDTAFPPVIRLSKPRAPSSRRTSHTSTLKGSQPSLSNRDEASTMGRLSAEPAQLSPSPEPDSAGSNALRRFIGRNTSQDSLSKDKGPTLTAHGTGDGPHASFPLNLKHSRSRSSLTADVIDEMSPGWHAAQSAPTTPLHKSRAGEEAFRSSGSPRSDRPASVGNGRVIPSRQSSLHHTTAGSSARKSSKRHRHKHAKKDHEEEYEGDHEAHSTLRRIRELQKQKKRREKEQRKEDRRLEKQAAAAATAADNSAVPDSNYQQSVQQKLDHSPGPGTNERVSDLHQRSGGFSSAEASARKRKSVGQILSDASVLSASPANLRHVNSYNPAANGGLDVFDSSRRRRSDTQLSIGRRSFGTNRPQSLNSLQSAAEAHLSSPSLSQRVRHPETGRVIAFSEVGDPDGFPVICCVGMGMTRYIMAFYDELASTLKLRLITIDRPGVGGSEPYPDGTGTPLNWPDDVLIVCQALGISKFSLVAHSAGAVYALATALRLPQQVRGQVHLMAAWIPPSQVWSATSPRDAMPSNAVPYTQKLLRMLPESFFRAVNHSLLSSNASSMSSKTRRGGRQKSPFSGGSNTTEAPPISTHGLCNDGEAASSTATLPPQNADTKAPSLSHQRSPSRSTEAARPSDCTASAIDGHSENNLAQSRRQAYDRYLTQLIWTLAQRNANPAIDLLVCIERRQSIGFQYVDITRPCVFHHGTRDSRVPVERVKWLAKKMRRGELRILEGEGHSLMASAKITGGVLTEVAREWEDWARVTKGGRGRRISSRYDD